MGSEWQEVTIGEIATIKHGFAFKGEYFTDEPQSSVLLTPGNFAVGGGFQVGKPKYYLGPIPADYVLAEGDLVVTMTDLSKASDTLGYAARVPQTTGTTYLHNQRTGLVQVKDSQTVRPEWLHYLMRTQPYRSWVAGSASGTTVKHTSPSRIGAYAFRLPPMVVQIDVASTLDAIEARIGLLRQTNTTLEAIAQALFKSWFVDFDPVHAKAEGREPEAMDAATATLLPGEFEASELGLIPKGWSASAVYDLAEFINGAAYKAFDPNREKRGLPIIKIAELKAGVTNQTAYSEAQMPEKYLIGTGDILFSWSGNPDTSIDTFVWSFGSAWLNQHIFRVVPRSSGERSFVLLALKYLRPIFAEIARDKQTTGLGHVTVADLKRLRIAKPDIAVLAQWSLLVDPLVERAFATQRQAQSLVELRDTLLPRLISGKLRLPEARRLAETMA